MKRLLLALTACATLFAAPLCQGQSQFLNPARSEPPGGWKNPAGSPVDDLDGVTIEQKLDHKIDLDLEFADSQGETVRLSSLFGNLPVVLAFVYFDCPMLCTLELNGLLKAMRAMDLDAGVDYRVLAVSFDPTETLEQAAQKKDQYMRQYVHAGFYDRERLEEGWNFLTGDEDSIRKLADAVGFRYRYDEQKDLYRHASGIMTLTPDGRVARYQFGVEYSARDLKFALMEASNGEIGNPIDAVMLYCFHYDPVSGKYGLIVMNALRVGAALTLALLVGFVGIQLLRERRRSRAAQPEAAA